MKQIYNFEQHTPPILNENIIRSEIERRKLQWQTTLLVLAGILIQVVVALFGYSAVDWYPWISVVCFVYIVISTTGCSVVAVAYSRKGGIPHE
jgi:hypothetical protein